MKGRRFRCIVAVVIWWLITASTLSLSSALQNSNATAIVPAHWNIPDGDEYILWTQTYGCGFYQVGENLPYYYFAVFIEGEVVWSGNRNSPVKMNSTLELKSNGDLVLKDADGTVVWSTDTWGKSVVGMNLTETGNLVLFDHKNRIVWQSFDHPTDSLLLGQTLKVGQKLTSSVSSTNLTESGLFSLTMTEHGLSARLETDPPQLYYNIGHYTPSDDGYVQFLNGSLSFFDTSFEAGHLSFQMTTNAQYMQFSSDGRLIVYEFYEASWWEEMEDVTNKVGPCGFPTVCGEYGICVSNGQCICPDPGNGNLYFNRRDVRQPELGCSAITPLTCEAHQYQSFLKLDGITPIGQIDHYNRNYVTVEACKEACANNCSCKAALFYHSTYFRGRCVLLNWVSSLMNSITMDVDTDIVIYIKVQNGSDEIPYHPTGVRRSSKSKVPIILATLGAALLLSGVLVFFIMKKRDDKNEVEEEEEEYYLDQVPGMPNRFSYDDLKSSTADFSKKLGQGGFASVFEGTLLDSTKIAVKWVRDIGQIKSSYLTEVKTIGSIHHVNLVKLVGFCAEKSHMMLVYEYMANGSLDRWIFTKKNEFVLTWERRKIVIFDIAKGLHYLHEDCRQKILHLDIKPQNILLDENFNAKVADFGLAKLIERDQSQVMTMMRGTPGYLAPEWLSSIITEKVDVYSFGVVVLEIVCGRKVFDTSEKEDDQYLLSLLKRKAEQGDLINMVGTYVHPVHELEAVNMMKLAAWCLQHNHTKRPSMSVVVKVLEGVMNVEEELDYNFWTAPTQTNRGPDNVIHASPPPLPSVLSAPR